MPAAGSDEARLRAAEVAERRQADGGQHRAVDLAGTGARRAVVESVL